MGLREDILSESVANLDRRKLVALLPTDTVRQAVDAMRRERLGCVVIVDDAGRPVGKFTEHHLLKLLVQGDANLDTPLQNHMTTNWSQVSLTDPISKVLDAMQEKGLRFIIVVDEHGKAESLTGQKGVMAYIADHFPRQVKVQMMESKLYMDQREGA